MSLSFPICEMEMPIPAPASGNHRVLRTQSPKSLPSCGSPALAHLTPLHSEETLGRAFQSTQLALTPDTSGYPRGTLGPASYTGHWALPSLAPHCSAHPTRPTCHLELPHPCPSLDPSPTLLPLPGMYALLPTLQLPANSIFRTHLP